MFFVMSIKSIWIFVGGKEAGLRVPHFYGAGDMSFHSWDRVSPHSPIASPSQMLEFQACSTAPSFVMWVFLVFLTIMSQRISYYIYFHKLVIF